MSKNFLMQTHDRFPNNTQFSISQYLFPYGYTYEDPKRNGKIEADVL